MRPDKRSLSFTWFRGQPQQRRPENMNQNCENDVESGENTLEKKKKNTKTCALRLGGNSLTKFGKKYTSIDEMEEEEEEVENIEEPQAEATNTLSLGKKINKKVQNVKASLESLSQRFRKTGRKYQLESSPISPTRLILGRTPTKLYSPFGFESPCFNNSPRRHNQIITPRFARKKTRTSPRVTIHSPRNRFQNDLREARKGLEELNVISRNITRRSVRF